MTEMNAALLAGLPDDVQGPYWPGRRSPTRGLLELSAPPGGHRPLRRRWPRWAERAAVVRGYPGTRSNGWRRVPRRWQRPNAWPFEIVIYVAGVVAGPRWQERGGKRTVAAVAGPGLGPTGAIATAAAHEGRRDVGAVTPGSAARGGGAGPAVRGSSAMRWVARCWGRGPVIVGRIPRVGMRSASAAITDFVQQEFGAPVRAGPVAGRAQP